MRFQTKPSPWLIGWLAGVILAPSLIFLMAQCVVQPDQRHLHVRWQMACDSKKRQVGLMNISHLELNQGLLMVFDSPTYPRIWSMGLQVDLDVAFLDAEHRIISIKPLAAPSLADQANRELRKKLYKEAICPPLPTSYVIEVARGWFAQSQIATGDQLLWLPGLTLGHVIHLPYKKAKPKKPS